MKLGNIEQGEKHGYGYRNRCGRTKSRQHLAVSLAGKGEGRREGESRVARVYLHDTHLSRC